MTLTPGRFQQLLAEFRLPQLFNELGWDKPTLRVQTIVANGESFSLTQIAQKRGVAVFRCSADGTGKIPPRPLMLKIEQEARKAAHEHLLVFADAEETMLTWLWVLRAPGQPTSTRTHTWHKGQSGESLRQKLSRILFTLDEEQALTLNAVTVRIRDAFDRDKVSKKFYDRFQQQHESFAEFIKGLHETADQAWYASLMLNRMMFVYFIQKKGFLDRDENYLQNKLAQVQTKAGKGKFHSFYRQFLRRLFHEGLGGPKPHESSLIKLIGQVPYLNGGLFDVHELEEANPGIDVPDEAFENLFAFFDDWDWHLDDRPLSSGKEINPDVLGYIFEKYINQKQMGAYYTKEDITEYISKNTIIPQLLDQVRERCKVAFAGEASVWRMLSTDPDRYIYSSVKVNEALPTETDLERRDRRRRYTSLRAKLEAGDVTNADDLVSLNLDVRQFMQDIVDKTNSPDLLRAIWQAIVGHVPEKSSESFRHGITILDPTCGSGAFLFAALNILEPLYEACLDRMEGFVEDAQKLGKPGNADFVRVLDVVKERGSRRYYIYKNIILHNLFGVDIMPEAVEICKLRLFLKLVSQVDASGELEPLPDIDFNIRAGNSLVGCATEQAFDAIGAGAFEFPDEKKHKARIKADIADLADLFDRFREQQTVRGGKVTPSDKQKLRNRLKDLCDELDRYLARDYGVDPDRREAFKVWHDSHQPFHWFAEFYTVMRDGGFDVVIGNPPYVAKQKVKGYTVKGYDTEQCADIYAWCLERVTTIADHGARTGMIVPLSLSFSGDFDALRRLIYSRYRANWFSHFAKRPAMLFNGVQIRNAIHVGALGKETNIARTTRLHRWHSSLRPFLFEQIVYAPYEVRCWGCVPKSQSQSLLANFEKRLKAGIRLESVLSNQATQYPIYFKGIGYNWISFGHFIPPAYDRSGKEIEQNGFGVSYARTEDEKQLLLLLLNGKIAFMYWILVGDDFHLTKGNFAGLPFDLGKVSAADELALLKLADELEEKISDSVVFMTMHGKRLGNFNATLLRPITDQSDRIFARIFGLTEAWDEVELFHSQIIRSAGDEQDTDDAQ